MPPRRALVPTTLCALLALGTFLPLAAPPGAARPPADASPPSDSAAVERVVRGLFDAMRAADSAAARRLFHPDARLARPVEAEDGVTLEMDGVQGFLDAVGGAEPGAWDERITDPRIRVDGRLATAWMEFVFHLGGERSHCGVNAFQLYRSDDGWKIFQISDTRRTTGCPELG